MDGNKSNYLELKKKDGKENPYDRAIELALKVVTKKGYVTDKGLDKLLDKFLEKVYSVIEPFVPPNSMEDIFGDGFLFSMYNYLNQKFEKKTGIMKKDLERADDVVTVYASDEENLSRGYEIEQAKIDNRQLNLKRKLEVFGINLEVE